MSRGSSCGSSRRSSSTTSPRIGSSSTTSPPPRVRVPRHVARLVTRLVASLVVDYSTSPRLVVDYSASRRLFVDYFASAARSGASARRAARHADHHAARRRLLRLRRASGFLSTSRGSSLVIDYSASRRLVARLVSPLVVDYFTYAACPGASARRATRHAARRAARRRLLRLAQARRRLLRLPRASGCLGTSRDSSRGSSRRSSSTSPPRAGSSSTTSPTPRVWVPRHVARLIACRRLLRLRRAYGCLGTSRGSSRGSSRHSSWTTPPHAGSSSSTSPTPRVWVPRHVARLVTRLVAPLVVDYSASRRLVVDYFTSA
jgi:hypothetical protein